MAWAEKQRSGRYAGKYRDAAQTVRSVGTFTRKAEAERRAGAKEDEVRRDPTLLSPADGRITWATWEQRWSALRGVEAATKDSDVGRINKHVRPRWGRTPLSSIRRDDVQQWVKELSESGLSASSVAHCYHLLSGTMKAAVDDRRISITPCRGIVLPAQPTASERFLTHEEANRIATVLAEPYRSLFLVLVGSGLRWGEAAALHWQRVDFKEGMIEVADAATRREIKPYPKSRKKRSVWLPPWLMEVLGEHRERYPPLRECCARHRNDSRCRSSLVFAGRGGAMIDYQAFRRGPWGRAVGRDVWAVEGDPVEGRVFPSPSSARRVLSWGEPRVMWQEGLAGVGWARIHDCRHTFASWSLQPPEPITLYELALAMGHSSMKTTERYAHLANTAADRYRRALAWSPLEPSSWTSATG